MSETTLSILCALILICLLVLGAWIASTIAIPYVKREYADKDDWPEDWTIIGENKDGH